MKIITAEKIRNMDERERQRKLVDLREELMLLYSAQTGGGLTDNPAKAKWLRKQIARILTIVREEALEEALEEDLSEEEEDLYEEEEESEVWVLILNILFIAI